MLQSDRSVRFENTVIPHLDAAYNLAKWLTQNGHDADDVVQEACLRAYQFFSGYRGGDSRAWFLRIVRNTCYTWLQKNRPHELIVSFDESVHDVPSSCATPEQAALKDLDSRLLAQAIDALPTEFREILILRDLEDLSYKQIAEIVDVPMGTVMSRLARARKKVVLCLAAGEENHREL